MGRDSSYEAIEDAARDTQFTPRRKAFAQPMYRRPRVMIPAVTLAIAAVVIVVVFAARRPHSNAAPPVAPHGRGEGGKGGTGPYRTALHDDDFPQFHVRPPQHWINDPNGPFRDTATLRLHLFMQYNPLGALWGNMNWWHATTTDYVAWEPVDIALQNDNSYDVGGVFSGSATPLPGGDGAVLLYTCVDDTKKQLQCVAMPNRTQSPQDRTMMKRWVKSPRNPIAPTEPPHANGDTNFRDPSEIIVNTAKSMNISILGGSAKQQPGDAGFAAMALVYAVEGYPEPTALTYQHALFTDPYQPSRMFECPDFWILDKRNATHADALWGLKFSNEFDYRDYYRLGYFHADENAFYSRSHPSAPVSNAAADADVVRLDGGKYYASKRFWDPTLGQYVLWGWLNEEASDESILARGWAGAQSIPRQIFYDPRIGKLRTPPIDAVDQYRSDLVMSFSSGVSLGPSLCLWLVNPEGTGNRGGAPHVAPQQEIRVNLSFPLAVLETPGARIGARIRANSTHYTFVGLTRLPQSDTAVLPNMNAAGGTYIAYPMDATARNDDNAKNCSDICHAHTGACVSWSYFPAGRVGPAAFAFSPRCELKGSAPALVADNGVYAGRTRDAVFIMDREESGSFGSTDAWTTRATVATAPGNATQGTLRLRVFVDHSVVEAYKDDGAEVISARLYMSNHFDRSDHGTAGVYVCGAEQNGTPNIHLETATVHSVDSIWRNL